MNSAPPRVVLFDLDGTLADTVPLIVETFRRTVSDALGWEPSPEQCKEWIGRSLADTFGGLAPDRADDLIARYLEWNLANHHAYVRPFDGVTGLVERLRDAGRTFGVVTSKRRSSAEVSLECVGLAGRIPLLATEDDTTTHKPAPEPLLHALRQVGADAGDAVYVGDAVVDLQAAQAAGMRSIGVTWGAGTEADLRAVGPTAVVHSVAELRTLLGL
ncbi:MAG: HAD hydrolase-like protein [Micropruina sp.]|uniref:HAD family hydrolase n=1 Tax=Micropruina sp. TaxID=2737536 RepID=UPI0039E6EFB2